MKILAIRGKNLASLTGSFEVDFNQEPLTSAGLYAISGPTGAGKSTLLDALCLSLYDNTPRLARAGAQGVLPDVKGNTVSPQDPRNLLSRGHGEGYAETDFVGNDGDIYRARWSVRRAHSKSDGGLQPSQMNLWKLSDMQAIGHAKTEVKAAIEARLGLSFAQFTRAVLLAQNEFAAFLKADDSERAELLQTLTGTDIFAALSKQAYQRYRQEESQLQGISQQMNGLNPLDAPERLQLEQEFAALEAEARTLNTQLDNLESQLQWHLNRQAAEQRKQQAEQQLDTARTEKTATAERGAHLQTVEAVQVARPLLDDYQREHQAVSQTTDELEQWRRRLVQAETAREKSLAAVMAQQQQVDTIQADQKAAAPLIETARTLDHALVNLRERESELAQHQTEAGQLTQQATEQLAAAEQKLAHTQQQLAATETWLHQHETLEALASGWPRWDALLQQAETVWQSLHASEADTTSLQNQVEQCQQVQAQAHQQYVIAEQQLARAESALAAIVLPMTHEEMEHALQQRTHWTLQREQLQAARIHWEKRRGCVELFNISS